LQVSCEALGVPRPSIAWFKDGHPIHDSVLPRRASDGRSTVELNVMGPADAGTYTCMAANHLGTVDTNFTLEVNMGSAAARSAIVTEAVLDNGVVHVGEVASLRCRVKSLMLPHIKWLKKLEDGEDAGDVAATPEDREKIVKVYTLNMGNERYRVLDTDPDVKVANDEYLNKLTLRNVRMEDSGMYICFVTNSGFGALTYKATILKVLPRVDLPPAPTDVRPDIVVTSPASDSETLVLVLVICLVSFTCLLGIVVVVCVMRRSRSSAKPGKLSASTSATSGASEHTTPHHDDVDDMLQRPFLMHDVSPSTLPPPPHHLHPIFSSAPASSIGQWSRTVYPAFYGHPPPHAASLSSSSTHYENPEKPVAKAFIRRHNYHPQRLPQHAQNSLPTVSNQYEVPYSHLMRDQSHYMVPAARPRTLLSSGSSSGGRSSNNSAQVLTGRQIPHPGNARHGELPIRNCQYFQYLSEHGT
jgi:hypothetical protein